MKNRPAQQQYPGWEKHNKRMDGWDWITASTAALCMAVGVYIAFNVPNFWYYTVVIGVWVLPIVGVAWFMIHHYIKGKQYPRTRTHYTVRKGW